MAYKPEYEYMIGYSASTSAVYRQLDKNSRLFPERYATLAEAIAARHAHPQRSMVQVYREMIVRG